MQTMLFRISCLLQLSLLVACATQSNTTPGGDPANSRDARSPDFVTRVGRKITVERSGDTVIYRGSMTREGFDAIRKADLGPPVTTLLIDSAGGEIVTGMEFGAWVFERRLDVVVDRACLSSCANYIFTAGKNKEIKPGAVVAWHGSAKQPGLLEQLHDIVEKDITSKGLPHSQKSREIARARLANVEYLTSAIQMQNGFFYRVGVDEYVTRIGNDQYGVRGFFYLSVIDMAEFGIDNVTAPEDYADMDPGALARRVGFPVSLVKLD